MSDVTITNEVTTVEITAPTAPVVEINTGGLQGPTGPAPTIAGVAVTTLGTGVPATGSISGSNPYTINLGIPTGPAGPAPTISPTITVTTGAPGTNASASWSGTNPYTLSLTIPRGAAGTGNVTSSGALVVGNLASWNSTAGLIQDAGFAASDVMRLSSAQVVTATKTFASANVAVTGSGLIDVFGTGTISAVYNGTTATTSLIEITGQITDNGAAGAGDLASVIRNGVMGHIRKTGTSAWTTSDSYSRGISGVLGSFGLEAGSVDSAIGVRGRVTSSAGATSTNVIGIQAKTNALAGTHTNVYGFYAANPNNAGTTTNNYGMYIETHTAATNNYGLGFASGTTVASGIQWGTDVSLYRSAASTLTTNATLVASVFSGSGASLTNLPAASLTGTIADARLPARLAASAGVIVTDVDTATDSGFWRAAAGATNNPSATAATGLTVSYSSGSSYQLAAEVSGTRKLYLRVSSSSTFGAWREIVTSDLGVMLAGAQTISGIKTFSANPVVAGSGSVTTLGQLPNQLLFQTQTSTANSGSEIAFRGTTSATDPLTSVYAAVSGTTTGNGTSGSIGHLVFSTKNAVGDTTLTERMRITNTGLITMANGLTVTGTVAATALSGTGAGITGVVHDTGAEPISGLKTFSTGIQIGSAPTSTQRALGINTSSSIVGILESSSATQSFLDIYNNTLPNSLRIGVFSSGVSGISNGLVTTPHLALATTGAATFSSTVTATSFIGSGASLTSLNASNLSTGVVSIAQIPTGTSGTTVALGNHNHDTVYVGLSSSQTITGAKSFSAIASFDVGGIAGLRVTPGSADYASIGIYARTATPATMSAFIGYNAAASTNFILQNSISGGALSLNTTGNGNITISAGTGTITLTGASVTATSFIGSGASLTGLTKTQVGLSNVDNTADTAKVIAQSQVTGLSTALGLLAPLASPTFTGTVSGITKSMVGLGNVDNTADASKAFAASQITSGVLATPRLGAGTADSTTFLRGDQTWATISGGSNSYKNPVRVASTANVTLTGPGTTVDGVTMSNGDRFLALGQTTGGENGIYVFNGSAVAATRASDADSVGELAGTYVVASEGSNAGRQYKIFLPLGSTLGTTVPLITFERDGAWYGTPFGVAPLDANAQVPVVNLPLYPLQAFVSGTAASSHSSSTPSAVTGLSLALGVGTYMVSVDIQIYSASSSAIPRTMFSTVDTLAVSSSGSSTEVSYSYGTVTGITGFNTNTYNSQFNGSMSLGASATPFTYTVKGQITVTTAGTIEFRMGASNGTIAVARGGTMTATKIA